MDSKLVDLLGLAMDAPLQPERWEQLLDSLVDHAGAISGVIVVTDPGHEMRASPFQSRFIRDHAPEMTRRFHAGEDADDAAIIQAMQQGPLNRLRSEAEVFGLDRLEELPPSRFRDFQRDDYGIYYRYGLPLNSFVKTADLMFLHAQRDVAGQQSAMRKDIELLAPLMGKTLRLNRVFEALRSRFNAVLGALDGLRLGAVLLLEDATIIQSNASARAILAADDGLKVDAAGRLASSDDVLSRALLQGISEVGRTAALEGWTAERAFTLQRPSGRPAYLMTLGPLVDSSGELERGLACIMTFITDPAETTPLSVEGLRELGQLTPAETEVSRYLVNGQNINEIAELRNVSRETVRSQVKATMSKLRCTSRLDLVRLAALTRLPVANEETVTNPSSPILR